MQNIEDVDWSKLPVPEDDGSAGHLRDFAVPPVKLAATDGSRVNLADLPGVAVVYIFPRTGRPDQPLPTGWDAIPGARGCTPQSCAFRDNLGGLHEAGAKFVFGLSTQTGDYQREAVSRLHLPFALLSDAEQEFSKSIELPTFEVDGMTLFKRMTLIISNGRIEKVFFPVFPPDRDAENVIAWLKDNIG